MHGVNSIPVMHNRTTYVSAMGWKLRKRKKISILHHKQLMSIALKHHQCGFSLGLTFFSSPALFKQPELYGL